LWQKAGEKWAKSVERSARSRQKCIWEKTVENLASECVLENENQLLACGFFPFPKKANKNQEWLVLERFSRLIICSINFNGCIADIHYRSFIYFFFLLLISCLIAAAAHTSRVQRVICGLWDLTESPSQRTIMYIYLFRLACWGSASKLLVAKAF